MTNTFSRTLIVMILLTGSIQAMMPSNVVQPEAMDVDQKEISLPNKKEIIKIIKRGSVSELTQLLDRGVSVDRKVGFNCTLLCYAAYYGHTDCVSLLLDWGADYAQVAINDFTPHKIALMEGHSECEALFSQRGSVVKSPDMKGWTPIHRAAFFGDIDRLKTLVDEDSTQIDSRTRLDFTPLLLVAAEGHEDCFRYLVLHGADIQAVDSKGRTVIHKAAQGGSRECVAYCLEKGLLIEAENTDGVRPLHYASTYGSVGSVRALLDGGAEVNVRTKKEVTALHFAGLKGDKAIMELLISHGADSKAVASNGVTVLHAAAQGGSRECVNYCLSEGLSIEAENIAGWRPLHIALKYGSVGCVKALLDKGADVHARTKKGETALHLAGLKGDKAIMELLISHGADIKAVDLQEITVLHAATQGNSVACVEFCLNKGLNPNARSANGMFPLHYAVDKDSIACIETLLTWGAHRECPDADMHTPLSLASKLGKLASLRYLISRNANIDARGGLFRTPLMLAVKGKHLSCIRLLVELGADLELIDRAQETAFCVALKKDSDEPLECMMRWGYLLFKPSLFEVREPKARVLVTLERFAYYKDNIERLSGLGLHPQLWILNSLKETSDDLARVFLAYLLELDGVDWVDPERKEPYGRIAEDRLKQMFETQEVKEAAARFIVDRYKMFCQTVSLSDGRKKSVGSQELLDKLKKVIIDSVTDRYLCVDK